MFPCSFQRPVVPWFTALQHLEPDGWCAHGLQGILLVSIPFCILGYLAMGVWLDRGGRSIRANVAVITAGGGMAFGVFYGAPRIQNGAGLGEAGPREHAAGAQALRTLALHAIYRCTPPACPTTTQAPSRLRWPPGFCLPFSWLSWEQAL